MPIKKRYIKRTPKSGSLKCPVPKAAAIAVTMPVITETILMLMVNGNATQI